MMGVTQILPSDRYPFLLLSQKGKRARIQAVDLVSLKTGHKPAYFNGPFPVWHHDYSDEELLKFAIPGTVRVIRQHKDERWYDAEGIWYVMGGATYHRDFSD